MKFVEFTKKPIDQINTPWGDIPSFMSGQEQNMDISTVDSFGKEWSKFNQFSPEEIQRIGDTYFDITTPEQINKESTRALDVGCGSGRWGLYIADKVKSLECIDPSDAVFVAKKNLSHLDNVRVSKASVESLPFSDESFDFVFSLGVLHHIPDTKLAIKNCTSKLKSGGTFLVYLYYNLDNRSVTFKIILKLVTGLRFLISKLPDSLKHIVCDLLAIFVYLPLISIARILRFMFKNSTIYSKIPLSFYIDKSFRVIRNDSLDRFGTPLEQRFSKSEITEMLKDAGLDEIQFSDIEPYWHATGKKV